MSSSGVTRRAAGLLARAPGGLRVVVRLVGVIGMMIAVLAGASSASAQALAADTLDPQISDGTAQHELDAAVARWQQAGVADYHFTVERICFCAPAFRGPTTIVVRDGRPLAPPTEFGEVATVPKLHAVVQQAIDDQVERLTAEYDGRGVPLSIQVDPSTRIADDEISFRVTDFGVDTPHLWAKGDLELHVRWKGSNGKARRTLVCRDGVPLRGWPDSAVCTRLLAAPGLVQPISVETLDLRSTSDPQLFRVRGQIEGRLVAFVWTGQGTGPRLTRLLAWETALGPDAIATVRSSRA